MSITTVEEFRMFARVIHAADDALIQKLLDGAEDEALQFMDRRSFGDICPCESSESSEPPPTMPHSVWVAVMRLAQCSYEGTKPEDVEKFRKAAETLLMPYRCNLGV